MDNLVVDSMSVSNQAVHTGNIWFWIAIIEVFVILYLASRLIFHPQKGHIKVKEQLKSAPINLGNTINSAFNSKPLYDKLKVKCHPDRFANTPLQDKGLASEPTLCPVTSARSAGSLRGFQRRRLWRLLRELLERLASLFPQAQVFQRK